MKLTIHQELGIPETEIIINCAHMDTRLLRLVELIRQYGFSLTGYQEEKEFQLPLEQIYFIDSADGRTFLYLEKEVFSCRETLAACQVIDLLIGKIEFRKWSHYCMTESVLLYLLSLLIFRMFIWDSMDISRLVSFTVIFLITDGFVFWYFRKRQEIQAKEINQLIQERNDRY